MRNDESADEVDHDGLWDERGVEPQLGPNIVQSVIERKCFDYLELIFTQSYAEAVNRVVPSRSEAVDGVRLQERWWMQSGSWSR